MFVCVCACVFVLFALTFSALVDVHFLFFCELVSSLSRLALEAFYVVLKRKQSRYQRLMRILRERLTNIHLKLVWILFFEASYYVCNVVTGQ